MVRKYHKKGQGLVVISSQISSFMKVEFDHLVAKCYEVPLTSHGCNFSLE